MHCTLCAFACFQNFPPLKCSILGGLYLFKRPVVKDPFLGLCKSACLSMTAISGSFFNLRAISTDEALDCTLANGILGASHSLFFSKCLPVQDMATVTHHMHSAPDPSPSANGRDHPSTASAPGGSTWAATNGATPGERCRQTMAGHAPSAPHTSHKDPPAAITERLAARSSRRELRAAAREAQAARSRRFSELEAARASQRGSTASTEPHSHHSSQLSSLADPMKSQQRLSADSDDALGVPSVLPHSHLPSKSASPAAPRHGYQLTQHREAPRLQAQLHLQAGFPAGSGKVRRRSKSLFPSLSDCSSHASGSTQDEPAPAVLRSAHQPIAAAHASATPQAAHGVHVSSAALASEHPGSAMHHAPPGRAEPQRYSASPASPSLPAPCHPSAASVRTTASGMTNAQAAAASGSQTTTSQSTPSQDLMSHEDNPTAVMADSDRVSHGGSAASRQHASASSARQQSGTAASLDPSTDEPGASSLQSQTSERSQQLQPSFKGAMQQVAAPGEAAHQQASSPARHLPTQADPQHASQQAAAAGEAGNAPQAASSPSRHSRTRSRSQDALQRVTAPGEAALELLSSSDAARQHRCKCKVAQDGSIPRPCRFCRNVRLMTRLAHQKQVSFQGLLKRFLLVA